MACIPVSRRKKLLFDVHVKLMSLTSVPFVNAVLFSKIRILNTRISSEYSSRVEVANNTATWNTQYKFRCKFMANSVTSTLESRILRVSIRMEANGGKSFSKVGFVNVDLACFAANESNHHQRRYILEAYNGKHRQDNSLLLLSIMVKPAGRVASSNFNVPPEDKSKCLFGPPIATVNPLSEAEDLPANTATTTVLQAPNLPPGRSLSITPSSSVNSAESSVSSNFTSRDSFSTPSPTIPFSGPLPQHHHQHHYGEAVGHSVEEDDPLTVSVEQSVSTTSGYHSAYANLDGGTVDRSSLERRRHEPFSNGNNNNNTTGSSKNSNGKQHLINSTRIDHDEVISLVFRNKEKPRDCSSTNKVFQTANEQTASSSPPVDSGSGRIRPVSATDSSFQPIVRS